MRIRTPVSEKGVLSVTVEAARGALEGTLTYNVGHVIEDEALGSGVARVSPGDAAVIMRQEVLAHLGTAHANVTHFAGEHLFEAPTKPLLLRVRIDA